ncbi:putative ribonuclease H-like domain-containing protein [Tanacetum coccineum]
MLKDRQRVIRWCQSFKPLEYSTIELGFVERIDVQFNENTPNIVGSRPNWLFDIDAITKSMNYKPVIVGNQSNGNAGTKSCDDAGKAIMETVPDKDYILLQMWTDNPPISQTSKCSDVGFKPSRDDEKKVNVVGAKTSIELPTDPDMPELEDIVYSDDDEDVSVKADMNNLDTCLEHGGKEQAIKTFKIACLLAFYHKKNPKRNKKDEKGIIIKNKARLVAQWYTQEEGIEYDEFGCQEMLFFMVKIKEKSYVFQPPGFEDPDFLDSVYKVEKALYGLHQAPRACQDKYVTEILKKFGFTNVKTASTPMERQKPLLKDKDGKEVDIHLYRSMIGLLMYPTSSRPDIMFTVCACARYQVKPKVSHLHAVKRIFRYLKGQPKLGLWYPKDLPFDLCKKQTVVANSIIEAEYVAASSCCGQVLWIQNQLLDYGEECLEWNGKVAKDEIRFLATAKAKTVNEEVQLQALVDRKKVIITETSIRRDLHLEDADGIDCLPNAVIFEQLTLMGAKTTTWNEFSSTMASAIICLATNQKFNFSKYIFDNMVKNVDSTSKFLMYPRFVQVFLNKQVDGMATHDEIYVTPSHTKKVFWNMKRVRKGFSRNITPLFPTMMVQAQQEQGEAAKAINEENVPTHSNGLLLSGEDRLKLEELMTLCTNLQNRVLDLEHTKTTQALEIESLKRRVKKLEKMQRLRTYKLKRLYKVGLSIKVVSSKDEGLDQEDASKQGRKIHDINADEDITLENVYDKDMFGVNDLEGDEVVVESEVAAKKKDDEVNVVEEVVSTAGDAAPVSAATITTVELTLAQTLAELKSARPKVKGLVNPKQEPSESTTTTTAGILLQEPSETRTTTTRTIPSKDKGKGIMVEEPLKMKKKDQVLFDEQEAIRLQAQFDEEARIAREKEEANAALIAQWNDI